MMTKKIGVLSLFIVSIFSSYAQVNDVSRSNPEKMDLEIFSSSTLYQMAEDILESDPKKALEYAKAAYDKADEYGSTVDSLKLLGLIYLKGGKEIYDYELAIKYLRKGAEMDQPDCINLMNALGEPFEEAEHSFSIGVSPN